jgi:hypothetical protein
VVEFGGPIWPFTDVEPGTGSSGETGTSGGAEFIVGGVRLLLKTGGVGVSSQVCPGETPHVIATFDPLLRLPIEVKDGGHHEKTSRRCRRCSFAYGLGGKAVFLSAHRG